ncbi:hypothetical protein [Streptomyces sp. NPDC088794]
MTWIEIACQLLAALVLGGLAVRVGAIDIPHSLAEMEDPPDPYRGG